MVAPLLFHVHPLKMFSSPADDWTVIAKQHCVCALKALRDQLLEKGLNPPEWMQVVKVNLLKTEASWATPVAIAGQKQAIDRDISALPPSEAAANFLMHLQDSPAWPDETAREHIHRTIPKAASGSAGFHHKFPTVNSKYVPLSNARPRNPNMATHPPHVQSYSVKAFGPFFTWLYHAGDAAVMSLDNFEKMDMPVTVNQLKFLQGLYEPSLLQRVAADMPRPNTNIKEVEDRASAYQKQQWINWHWGAAPDSVIPPTRSMFPSQGGRQTRKQGERNLLYVSRGESGREGTVARLGCPLVSDPFGGLAVEIRRSVAEMGNTQQGAILDGKGKYSSKAWVINGPWSPACTTGIAFDRSQVHGVRKSGHGEH